MNLFRENGEKKKEKKTPVSFSVFQVFFPARFRVSILLATRRERFLLGDTREV